MVNSVKKMKMRPRYDRSLKQSAGSFCYHFTLIALGISKFEKEMFPFYNCIIIGWCLIETNDNMYKNWNFCLKSLIIMKGFLIRIMPIGSFHVSVLIFNAVRWCSFMRKEACDFCKSILIITTIEMLNLWIGEIVLIQSRFYFTNIGNCVNQSWFDPELLSCVIYLMSK